MGIHTEDLQSNRCFQLVSGILGIYSTYLIVGIIQEWVIKMPYENIHTGASEHFTSAIHFIMVPHGITCLIGAIYNHFTIPVQQKAIIPIKNGMICGLIVMISGLTFNYAIMWTSYPIVTIGKSCNILSVILVGTCCSRVTDARLKLTKKKILVGMVATVGIICFKFFDPETKTGDEKKTEIMGLFFLFLSLLADGFLPDFQAEIKIKYKPQPTEMMVEVNKWVCILSLVYAICIGQAMDVITFSLSHPLFAFHLLALGILGCIGQFFIYRMIKQFKQHFVPFVITIRKIFTVAISIVVYGHTTNAGQIGSILLVILVVLYEFISELWGEKRAKELERERVKIEEDQLHEISEHEQLPSEELK